MSESLAATQPKSSRALIIWALGLTQIIGYGTLYYSFSVLAPAMATDFGWPQEWIYGALSASLLVGGLVAPVAGTLADRFGAGRVMSWGSVGASAALALCALASERISFVAALMVLEMASAFVLYSTAFTLLAQTAGSGAQRSITHLTLIAGFASTIFWPVTSLLHQTLSWREVYLVYAILNLVACAPIHVWLAGLARRAAQKAPPVKAEVPDMPRKHGSGIFLLMVIGFALQGFVSSAVLVHMVPLMGMLGLGASGVLVTTLFGPAQVLSRLINMQFGRGLSQPALAVIAAGLMPAALTLLTLTAPWVAGAAAFAILFGLGSGLSSIVSGTLPLVLFGPGGYGRRLGWIGSARSVVSALAPFVFAALTAALPTPMAIGVIVVTGTMSAAAFVAVWVAAR
jgi:hypothetical protein